MESKTSWERLYDAMLESRKKFKSRRMPYSAFYTCLSMTPGLAFTEGSTVFDILKKLEEMDWIKIHDKYILIRKK